MKKDNIILKKNFDFALKIIELYKSIISNHKEYVLSKQILRSGTSIGANSKEAAGAQSTKDFISKFSIAYKEARETNYWLRLLKESGYIDNSKAEVLIEDWKELERSYLQL